MDYEKAMGISKNSINKWHECSTEMLEMKFAEKLMEAFYDGVDHGINALSDNLLKKGESNLDRATPPVKGRGVNQPENP
jgi:hypothetical protein